MVYVAELARLAGRLDDETAARHAAVLGSVGLPTSWSGAPFDDLLAVMRVDKKARGDSCASSCSTGWPGPRCSAARPRSCLRAAYAEIQGERS